MPLEIAVDLATRFFYLVPKPHTYFTNGDWSLDAEASSRATLSAFSPISDATLDSGVVCLGDGRAALYWSASPTAALAESLPRANMTARTTADLRQLAVTLAFTSVLAGALSACRTASAPPVPPVTPAYQAISPLGDTLRTLPLSAETRARYERQLAEARTAYEHTPTNVDSIIWYARRLGYLGQSR